MSTFTGRRRRRAAALAAAAALVVTTLAPVAAAQPEVPSPTSTPALQPPTVPPATDLYGPPIGVEPSPEVAAVPARSAELDPLQTRFDGVETRRARDTSDRDAAMFQVALTRREVAAHAELVARRREQLDKAEAARVDAAAARNALATERLVHGDHLLEGLDPSLSTEQREDLGVRKVLTAAATSRAVGAERSTGRRAEQLRDELEAFEDRHAELAEAVERLDARIAELGASIDGAATELFELGAGIQNAKMRATVTGTDISVVALDAYWRAARHLASTDPDCGMQWWMLAGIGRVESRHGTYRGSAIGADGVVSPPIFGPDLDGSNPAWKVIPDSDGGRLDGTARTDRAVGPMQFLPGTWRTNGVDLTGDGVADPQNYYDAAASAGRYLCRKGPGLGDVARLRAAYLSYNRSEVYAAEVLAHAATYLAAVLLPEL